MRSAVDSSILLDILLPDERRAAGSLRLLEEHAARGSLSICPVVFTEVAAAFTPTTRFDEIAREMGLAYDDFTPAIATLAAQMWQDYRRKGGRRTRVVADFLIGAHAQLNADLLLTRDRGYFRDHFHGLKLVAPAEPS